MRESTRAWGPQSAESDPAGAHAPGRRSPQAAEVPGQARSAVPGQATAALLGLQRSAGNAAVVQMLRAGRAPTAPAAAAPPVRRDDEEGAAAGLVEEPSPSSLVGDVPVLEPGERPSQPERTEKLAQRDLPPAQEEQVDTSGGPFPIARPASAAETFVDAGRAGSVPFGLADDDGFDPLEPGEDLRPRVFVAGGQTGKKAWAGGGGAGPKGNQKAGSLDVVEPKYDTDWGGITGNASAWVMEGTGTVKVTRDYVSSDAGDQGNGWYVTDKAAAALKAHEERHVASSRSIYVSHIQPLLDRIVNSWSYGRQKVYKSADAEALVRRYVSWPKSIEGFTEADIAANAPNQEIDTNDVGSSRYPVPFNTPRKVNGKDFPYLLRMGDEPNPPE